MVGVRNRTCDGRRQGLKTMDRSACQPAQARAPTIDLKANRSPNRQGKREGGTGAQASTPRPNLTGTVCRDDWRTRRPMISHPSLTGDCADFGAVAAAGPLVGWRWDGPRIAVARARTAMAPPRSMISPGASRASEPAPARPQATRPPHRGWAINRWRVARELATTRRRKLAP